MLKKQYQFLIFLLTFATLLLTVGLVSPMITMSKFLYIRSSFSVLSGVYELLRNGQIILFVIVTVFSVVLPVIKIAFLFKILFNIKNASSKINSASHKIKSNSDKINSDFDKINSDSDKINSDFDKSLQRYLGLMHEYGRWAMLDVMVVAVLIVTVKLKAIATIKVHAGLYIFGASVLLIMFITNKVVKLSNKA
ncbi:Paraquat-inducible protein A [Desulfamplus magnetovallimortis]|uniref:Paraquat-inducible protein A n=1 Tax=Desulfamplus magnetovallimortis TaxID=1246637 RepID=A0A1W1HH21_9BACT|nr:paraquat-inducible protein A [Desulfamplus magnetovallimortis]SLM31723.1 Paraquat-inducible protein A [Desulfamplus magnetovallimortis]